MRPISSNGRGPVGPAITYPGETPAERYSWLMSRLSPSQQMALRQRRRDRIQWLRENNPRALAA